MCGCSRSWPSDPLEESYLTVDGRESIQDSVDSTLLRTGGRTFLATETAITMELQRSVRAARILPATTFHLPCSENMFHLAWMTWEKARKS